MDRPTAIRAASGGPLVVAKTGIPSRSPLGPVTTRDCAVAASVASCLAATECISGSFQTSDCCLGNGNGDAAVRV
jgi:hypothetical protein